ncbi:MAG: hypothetical protein COA50_03815 [Flavobacteriaceae bacterium]|nr:MAG: hypothetical protein COA50_03815 [Flavobacteriaceae bacterium]
MNIKTYLNLNIIFECLGRINIIEGLKKVGSYGYSQNFQRFEERYSDLEKEIKVFRYEKYPLKLVTEK